MRTLAVPVYDERGDVNTTLEVQDRQPGADHWPLVLRAPWGTFHGKLTEDGATEWAQMDDVSAVDTLGSHLADELGGPRWDDYLVDVTDAFSAQGRRTEDYVKASELRDHFVDGLPPWKIAEMYLLGNAGIPA